MKTIFLFAEAFLLLSMTGVTLLQCLNPGQKISSRSVQFYLHDKAVTVLLKGDLVKVFL